MEQTIHGKTIKQIFKARQEWNNIRLLLGADEWQLHDLSVYVDDERVYRGSDYKEFVKRIREIYFKSFTDIIENLLMCAYYNEFVDVYGGKHIIQILGD